MSVTEEQCKKHKEECEEFFINAGSTFWSVDEANSIECFEKGEFCFVKQAFTDRETAVNFLNKKGFGGIAYNPANIPELIPPVSYGE